MHFRPAPFTASSHQNCTKQAASLRGYGRCTNWQRRAVPAAAGATAPSSAVFDNLLAWTSRGSVAQDNTRLVHVAELPQRGRGLVAMQVRQWQCT